MTPLNNIDVAILVIVTISMLVAFVRGFVKEILSIVGLIIFILLLFYLSPILTVWMNQFIASKLMAQFVVCLVIMAIFYAFWIIGTDTLISNIRKSTLSFMDRLFGLIFGFLRAVLIVGFSFLIVRIVLPEELESAPLKDAKYFMKAKPCADLIEKMLPDEFIKNTLKSVEDLNKVEKKDSKKDIKKENSNTLPSKLDQKQMDDMFNMLVSPQIKKDEKKTDEKVNEEKSGYDKKDTNSLDKLIDMTVEQK